MSIGVIATPASAAQDVCDRLVAAGVTSILNFAPLVLSVPPGVGVRKVDLATELQILAFHEQRKSDLVAAPAMTVLVVGLSHRSAPVALLERAVVAADDLPGFTAKVAGAEHVGEAIVVSTCNRVEAYAVVDRVPRRGRGPLGASLAERAGLPLEDLDPAPLRPLRRPRRAAPLLGGLRPGLDGRRRGPDPRSGPARPARRRRTQGTHAARRWAGCSRTRSASASAPTPRRASTGPAPRWCPGRWTSPTDVLGPVARAPASCSSGPAR